MVRFRARLYIAISLVGQKQTFAVQTGMSALLPKADIERRRENVRYVPQADNKGFTQ